MLTNKKLCFNLSEANSKVEVLELISDKLEQLKLITSKDKLIKAFLDREKEFSTGIGDGFAIPHAICDQIKEPLVVVARVKDIDWDSIDKKPVKSVVGIIVPSDGRKDHMQILTQFSRKLVNDDFKKIVNSGSFEKLVHEINSIKIGNEEDKADQKVKEGEKFIIGITACPVGVAHTFMAQQKILDAAKKIGAQAKVETQGSEGVKDKLTVQEIQQADAIIISSGINLEFMERFDGFEGKIYRSELQNTIKNGDQVIQDALKLGQEFNKDPRSKNVQMSKINAVPEQSKMTTFFNHLMSGISAMIPVLVIAGLFMAIANIASLAWTLPDDAGIYDWNWVKDENIFIQLMYFINCIGGMIMKFMYPFFTMYLAYSIAGKLALVPGFLGGGLASGLHTMFVDSNFFIESDLISWAYPDSGFISSSFFGAIIIGFFVGYFTKWLNDSIQLSPNLLTLKTLLIIPLVVTMSTFLLMEFAINPVFGWVNYGIQFIFQEAGEGGKYIYNWSIASGVAFDLGGPINKAAMSIGMSMNADAMQAMTNSIDSGNPTEIAQAVEQVSIFSQTAICLGITIPAMGMGFAAIMGNRVTNREIFSQEMQNVGAQSMFLSTIGISEGAIPFVIRYPAQAIPSNIIGSIVGVTVALLFGSVQVLPMSAVWGYFLVGTTYSGIAGFNPVWIQISGYIMAQLIGMITVAFVFITLLSIKDIRENIKAKVYDREAIDSTTEQKCKASKIEQSIIGLNMIEGHVVKEYESIGIESTSKETITDIKFKLSRILSNIAKSKKELTKASSSITHNDTKIRVINNKITIAEQRGKSTQELHDRIATLEKQNEQLEAKVKELTIMYADYVKIQLNSIKKYRKELS